jgi:hypothetical protein
VIETIRLFEGGGGVERRTPGDHRTPGDPSRKFE